MSARRTARTPPSQVPRASASSSHHGNVEAALRRHAAVLRAVGDDAATCRGLRVNFCIYAPLPHDGVRARRILKHAKSFGERAKHLSNASTAPAGKS